MPVSSKRKNHKNRVLQYRQKVVGEKKRAQEALTKMYQEQMQSRQEQMKQQVNGVDVDNTDIDVDDLGIVTDPIVDDIIVDVDPIVESVVVEEFISDDKILLLNTLGIVVSR